MEVLWKLVWIFIKLKQRLVWGWKIGKNEVWEQIQDYLHKETSTHVIRLQQNGALRALPWGTSGLDSQCTPVEEGSSGPEDLRALIPLGEAQGRTQWHSEKSGKFLIWREFQKILPKRFQENSCSYIFTYCLVLFIATILIYRSPDLPVDSIDY